MKDRFVSALAATLTTLLFGFVGAFIGGIVALLFNGALTLFDSDILYSLMKSGCVGFALGAISAIAALITNK